MAASRQTMLRALKQLRLRGGPRPTHRVSAQRRTFASGGTTHGGGSQGDLESALLLKNKVESAKVDDLWSSGNLIAQHCGQTEQTIGQSVKVYYDDKAGFQLALLELQEMEERQRQVGADE